MFGWTMAQFLNILELEGRNLKAHNVSYNKLDNVLISVGDMRKAQKFADRFQRLKWPKILNRYARLVNPQMQDILRSLQ
jgi:hypothetical protein